MHHTISVLLGLAVVIATAEVPATFEDSESLSLFDKIPSKLSLYIVKTYMRDLVEFQNCTTNEEYLNRTVALMQWRAPKFILDNYPFHLSGFTDENNPVWLVEGGKFDVVALVKQGPEMVAAAEKTIAQAILLGLRSIETGRTLSSSHEIPRAVVIVDFDEFRLSNFDSPAAIEWMIQTGLRHRLIADFLLEEAYLINVNFLVQNLVELFKPIVGHLLERVQIFGTIKSRWLPVLAQRFPEEALPFKYGGTTDHRHLFTYG